MAIRKLLPVLTDFLIDKDFIWHVTANFNRTTNFAAGRDKLKTWASFVDRKLHGRRYYLKPAEDRWFFVATPELGACGDNLHYHLLVRVPSPSKANFKQVAEPIWQSLVRCGSLYVQEIGDSLDDQKRGGQLRPERPISSGQLRAYDFFDRIFASGCGNQ